MTTTLDVGNVPPQGGYVAKQCPVRARLHYDLDADRTLRVAPTDAEQARMHAGIEFELGIASSLVAHHGAIRIKSPDRTVAQAETLEAIDRRVPAIVGADLADDTAGRRTGRPDLLLRVDPLDASQPPRWVPVDVKHHRLTEPADGSTVLSSTLGLPLAGQTPTVTENVRFRRAKLRDDALQLAHYWRMLEHHGLAPLDGPAMGGIIDRDERVWWVDLTEPRWKMWWSAKLVSTLEWYDHEFAFRLDVIADTLARNLDLQRDPKVVPVWTGECRTCPWRAVCRVELDAEDHVSLLPGSTYERWVQHRRRGSITRTAVANLDPATAWVMYGDKSSDPKVDLAAILTAAEYVPLDTPISSLPAAKRSAVTRLAAVGLSTVDDLSLIHPPTAAYEGAKVGHLLSVINQARAAVSGTPWRARGVDAVTVPRADVEVDVDMESTEDGVYLWGALVRRSGADPEYTPFVTWEPLTPESEAAVFMAFWSWLTELRDAARAAGSSFAAYYYTSAENTQMRRILRSGQPDLPPTELVESFIDSEQWIDLHDVFTTQVLTGAGGGLKTVAQLAGFAWRDDDPGGDQSTVWYRSAVDPANANANANQIRLLRYNEDDVLATRALREWLSKAELPSIDEWTEGAEGTRPAPPARPKGPAKKRGGTVSKAERTNPSQRRPADGALVTQSKNTIRDAARRFSADHANDVSEQADRQTFWDDFFSIFGRTRREVAFYEHAAERASTGGAGWIDLLYPGQMAVEHKSAGADLDAAMAQLYDYLGSLHTSEMPWLLVVCDFQRFRWTNLETRDNGEFTLAELADNLDQFMWLASYDRPGERFETQEDANLKATELLAAVHDQIEATGYDEHALRQWITRVLFCLFADDAGIWDRDLMSRYLYAVTRTDGSDLGSAMALIFQVLNTPPGKRAVTLDEDLADFAYVNGDLFAEILPMPSCTEPIRTALLEACRFNWSRISPAIFGSLFQNVMTPKERRHLGAHYTTEQNILRTIEPLFLDDLTTELAAATSEPKLRAFHAKLGNLTFFDPACGCGNFLVIAYRELRRLETETLRRLTAKQKRTGQRTMSLDLLCKVTVDQFYGIEIEEFPALIARTALYLADHLANRDVSAEFGEHYLRFPIPASPHIHIGNALRLDWNDVLPSTTCDFVFGNPPFVGFAYQSDEQKIDMRGVFGDKAPRRMDYVAAWWDRARTYSADRTRVAFVSTNSITQGEQVVNLWSRMLGDGFKIGFAHRTFNWSSEARGKAHVHCVIVGTSKAPFERLTLFDYEDLNGSPIARVAKQINPYLADAPDVIVERRNGKGPLVAGWPTAVLGSKPNDGGHLILDPDFDAALIADPTIAPWIRPLWGSRELMANSPRMCLWLRDAPPSVLRHPLVRDRLERVAEHRRRSPRGDVAAKAATPYLFEYDTQPSGPFLAVPEVSSERRSYIPIRYLDADDIVTNKVIVVPDATLGQFGVLTSSMFMAWVRAVGGRLKSDLSPSPGTVFNTFPFPDMSGKQLPIIESAAGLVLAERAARPDASLADLYDPLAMPASLVSAHRALDKAVDALFGRHRHTGDASRLRVLFRRYAQLTGGDLTLFDDE